METVKEYFRLLADRQEKQILSLYEQARQIIAYLGIEVGDEGNRQLSAHLHLGSNRYELRQPKGNDRAPITVLRGGGELLQTEPETDLEESGVIQPPMEIAYLSVSEGSIDEARIYGKDADPHRSYIFGLDEVSMAVGLWDDIMEARARGVFSPVVTPE